MSLLQGIEMSVPARVKMYISAVVRIFDVFAFTL